MAEQFETPAQIIESMLARKARTKIRIQESMVSAMDHGASAVHMAHEATRLAGVEGEMEALREVLAEITPVSTEFARLQSHTEHCTANTCCVTS